MFACIFIYAKLGYRKRMLNVFYFRSCFSDSQIKNYSVSLWLFKIVADQKPQTIVSFFTINTKLCYRKKQLNDKLKHKLYKC